MIEVIKMPCPGVGGYKHSCLMFKFMLLIILQFLTDSCGYGGKGSDKPGSDDLLVLEPSQAS